MVADEKFKPTTSISGRALKAENKVIVLPEPGGPHKTVHILKYLILVLLKVIVLIFDYELTQGFMLCKPCVKQCFMSYCV